MVLLRQVAGQRGRVVLPPDRSPGWDHVDLVPFLDGSFQPVLPTLGHRTDGVALLYPGMIHWLSGEPETGKSMIALALAAQAIAHDERVFYIDYEGSLESVLARLQALGVASPTLPGRFVYFAPDLPFERRGALSMEKYLPALGPSLVVIDSCNESMAIEGLDPNPTLDVITWITRVAKWLARRGPAVLVIDHVAKKRDGRGAWAVGSQAKKAGTDVAFMLEAKEPFGIGMSGRSSLYVAKDRHGQLRRQGLPAPDGKTWIGDVVVSEDGGRTTVEITQPTPGDGHFQPTTVMRKVSEALSRANEPLNTTGVVARVSARKSTVLTALAELVDGGWVKCEVKSRSKLHTNIRAYSDGSQFPGVPNGSGDLVVYGSPLKGGEPGTINTRALGDEDTEMKHLFELLPGEAGTDETRD